MIIFHVPSMSVQQKQIDVQFRIETSRAAACDVFVVAVAAVHYTIVRMYSVSTCGSLIFGFVVVAFCVVFIRRFCSSYDESMMCYLILNSVLFLGQANFRHVNEIHLSQMTDVYYQLFVMFCFCFCFCLYKCRYIYIYGNWYGKTHVWVHTKKKRSIQHWRIIKKFIYLDDNLL